MMCAKMRVLEGGDGEVSSLGKQIDELEGKILFKKEPLFYTKCLYSTPATPSLWKALPVHRSPY